jgi:hypothetical protein
MRQLQHRKRNMRELIYIWISIVQVLDYSRFCSVGYSYFSLSNYKATYIAIKGKEGFGDQRKAANTAQGRGSWFRV